MVEVAESLRRLAAPNRGPLVRKRSRIRRPEDAAEGSAIAVGYPARELTDRRMLVGQIGRERTINEILQLTHQGDGVRRIETEAIEPPFAIDLRCRLTGPLRHVRSQHLFDLVVALYRVLL
jgi:hypothetical protein